MYTETKRALTHGFHLTEAELRRLIETLSEQLQHNRSGAAVTTFELRYRNDAISRPNSIDEIVGQENAGTSQVVGLKISGRVGEPPIGRLVEIGLLDISSSEGDEKNPIRYTITGEDRDWVFITVSKIEERLSKIKRINYFSFIKSKYLTLMFMMALMVGIFGSIVYASGRSINRRDQFLSEISQLHQAWKDGRFADPIDFHIELSKTAFVNGLPGAESNVILYVMLSVVAVFVMSIFLLYVLKYFFPVFNFYWGDYMAIYDRKTKSGRFVFGSIIGTSLLAIVTGYVTNLIPHSW